jgi:tetratricopeptide (TPR) repeat protein
MRSAYRFLQKGKPDHAMRELEKARRKMGNNYWFHYYMGGAYYFKGLYEKAGDSWTIAFSYTNDYRLRSRVRTCQSFAVNYSKGDEPSIGFLRTALDMDRDNRHARELLEDLVGSGGGSDVQVGFMRPSESAGAKDNNYKGKAKSEKGQGKDDRKKGKSVKEKKKPKKIRDKDRFRGYFMVEMP